MADSSLYFQNIDGWVQVADMADEAAAQETSPSRKLKKGDGKGTGKGKWANKHLP